MNRTASASLIAVTALGLAIVPALGASAHTPAAVGTATCADDGTYSVAWVYSQTNTPAGAETDVKVIDRTPAASTLVTSSGTQWLNTWAEHKNGMTVGTLTGDYSVAFSQTGIAGTETSAAVYIQTDYKNGPDSTDVWFETPLDGTCVAVVPPVVTPPVVTPPVVTPPTTTPAPTPPPTSTPAPSAPPAAEPAPRELASTGPDFLPLVVTLSGALLLVGLGIVAVVRSTLPRYRRDGK